MQLIAPGGAALRRQRPSAGRLAEERLCGIGEGVGELPVLHQLADMAIEGGANCRELGEMNVPGARLDAMVGQARHAEDAGCCRLRQPQCTAPPP